MTAVAPLLNGAYGSVGTANFFGSATLTSSFGTVSVTDGGSGTVQLAASTTDRFLLELAAGQLQATLTPAWQWNLGITDASEAATSGNPTVSASASQAGVAFDQGGSFQSARLSLSAANGDARAGVRATVQLQRYTSAGWVTMTEDRGCVTVRPENVAVSAGQGVFTTSAGLCAAPMTTAATTAGGRAQLTLPATPGGKAGRLTLRLAGSADTGNSCTALGSLQGLVPITSNWLLGGSSGSGPAALATWGAASRDLVLKREVW
jgi:hypothetical protein